jgi:parvulin-like peptidyl-prolyl isomerase
LQTALAFCGRSEADATSATIDSAVAIVDQHVITASEVEARKRILERVPELRGGSITYQDALETEIQRWLLIFAAEREFSEPILEHVRATAIKRYESLKDPRTYESGPDQKLSDALYHDLLIQAFLETKVSGRIQVTPGEVKAFYRAHPALFSRRASVTIRQILIREYERATEDARAIAEKAAARVEAGEDFAAVARELSEGPYKEDGGLWPPKAAGELVEPVEEAVAALEPGEMSGAFHTPLGWHIVRVEERTADDMTPFEEVQESIHRELKNRKENEARTRLMMRLREKATIKLLPGETDETNDQTDPMP